MNYYFNTLLHTNFETALTRVTNALETEGFGVVTKLDLQEKFKEKLGVDFKKYTILGACNPAYAYKALQAEEKVGTMLPCNIIVIDKEDGTVEIAAINPIASMMAIKNPELEGLANKVTEKIQRVIESL